jgi:putative protease
MERTIINIQAPFDSVEEARELISAGADELYCGMISREWEAQIRFKSRYPNSRSAGFYNLHDYGKLKEVVSMALGRNIPVFVCMNAPYFKIHYPLVLEEIKETIKVGVSGIILYDIGLFLALKKEKIPVKLILSSIGACLNSEAVKMYKELGISRIILPSDLTFDEINAISRKSGDIELEHFIFNLACNNINGYCQLYTYGKRYNFLNNQKLKIISDILPAYYQKPNREKLINFVNNHSCFLPYKVLKILNSEKVNNVNDPGRNLRKIQLHGLPGCSVCAMPMLHDLNIKTIKIAGRGKPTQKKIDATFFVRRLREFLLGNHPTEDEFMREAKRLFHEIFKRRCENDECHFLFLKGFRRKWKEEYL